jgi:hypothetical protein
MNKELTNQIVKHIFANLGVLKTGFINMKDSKVLPSKEFLLTDKLIFGDDNGVTKNNIWGCQISSEQQELKILLGDCSPDRNTQEYCLLVQLKDSPAYGLYLIPDSEEESMIAVSMNGTDWMECFMFLQATFLAGMEQVRDMGFGWSKCLNYKDHLDMMKSFIKYHELVFSYEESDEGQKD